MKILFTTILTLTFYCCLAQSNEADTSIQKLPSDTTKFATLYVYRNKKFAGSMISYALRMDNPEMTGKVLQTVKNNSFFIVKLYNEGQTILWAKTETKSSVMVNVKYGQSYYLRCAVSMGIMAGRPRVTPQV